TRRPARGCSCATVTSLQSSNLLVIFETSPSRVLPWVGSQLLGARSVKRSIDPNEFRTVLGSFCTGLTLISTLVEDQPSGLICQSFFSLSMDPPLVACAVAQGSTSYPAIR